MWVAGFSPSDISGPKWPKNVKFGTKVASNTRMMRTLEKLLIAAKLTKNAKNRPKMSKNEHILLHALPQKPQIVEMRKLAQT